MKFHRIGNWAELSDCGLFTVAATRHQGRYLFTAFRVPVVQGAMATSLGTFSDSQAARDCCAAAGDVKAA